MGDHDDCLARLHQALEKLEDRLGGGRIQVAGRLVRQDQRRIVDQGAGDGHALLLPAGDVRWQFVSVFAQLDQVEQLQGPLAC